MAESQPDRSSDVSSEISDDNEMTLECAVCLQICVHPAELPCGHIFCYLCIKGIVNRNRRCAMCRRDIPPDYLDNPTLINPVENDDESQALGDGYSWFYEGHEGWWQYDVRTNTELETAYQNGERICEILVAGFLYVADFDSMIQYRKNDASRRRRIKRDLATTNKKGVAGLRLLSDTTPESSSNAGENVLIAGMENLRISNRPVGVASNRGSHGQPNVPVPEEPDMNVHLGAHDMFPFHLHAYENDQAAEIENEIDLEDLRSAQALNDALGAALGRLDMLQIQLTHEYDLFNENVERYNNLQSGNRRIHVRRPPRGTSASMPHENLSLEPELDVSNRPPTRTTGTQLNRSEENVSSSEGNNETETNESDSQDSCQTD